MTDLTSTWVETLRRIRVDLAENDTICYAIPGEPPIRVTGLVAEVLLPFHDVKHLTAYGVTWNGTAVRFEFSDGYPDIFTQVIPAVIRAGEAAERAAYAALLSPAEVARLCDVPASRVRAWYLSGFLETACRTSGGHRRFLAEDVARLRAVLETQADGTECRAMDLWHALSGPQASVDEAPERS